MSRVQEQPRADRVPVRLVTQLRDGNYPLTLLNLSTTGMLLNSPRSLRIGDSVEVNLPEVGAVNAQVVWRDADEYGCRFVAPIPESVVAAAARASRRHRPQPVQSRRETRRPVARDDTRALVMLIVFLTVVVVFFSLMQGID